MIIPKFPKVVSCVTSCSTGPSWSSVLSEAEILRIDIDVVQHPQNQRFGTLAQQTVVLDRTVPGWASDSLISFCGGTLGRF